MPFPLYSLYEIHEKGRKPFLVRVIHSNPDIHKTRVMELSSGAERNLFDYLKDDVEIYHIPIMEGCRNKIKARAACPYDQ